MKRTLKEPYSPSPPPPLLRASPATVPSYARGRSASASGGCSQWVAAHTAVRLRFALTSLCPWGRGAAGGGDAKKCANGAVRVGGSTTKEAGEGALGQDHKKMIVKAAGRLAPRPKTNGSAGQTSVSWRLVTGRSRRRDHGRRDLVTPSCPMRTSVSTRRFRPSGRPAASPRRPFAAGGLRGPCGGGQGGRKVSPEGGIGMDCVAHGNGQ